MNFCGVTRFTLLLSPRAAVLMLTNAKEIETSWILPYDSDQFYDTLLGALKRHPFYPLKIVVDSAHLDVRMETLPPVSPWARKSIVERQRAHFFPKAQLEVSEAFHDKATGKWNVLHAATPEEAWLQPIFDRLRQIVNPIEPLSFFATEWFDYARQVSIMPQKGWAFVNVLCESFGLRQLVLNDGKLVFTRSHPDCVPSMAKEDLAGRIAEHVQSTLDYLPRLRSDVAGNIMPRLYVADTLSDIEVPHTQVVAIASPKAAHVPVEWAADITWLHIAAQEKHSALPIDTGWLRQMRDGIMKKQIAVWVLLAFGSAGIFSGMSILTSVGNSEHAAAVPAVIEPVKPVSQLQPEAPLATPPQLTLNAVIYNSRQDWVVWINGEKHLPGETTHHLTMIDVSPQSVSVHWQDGKAEQQMTLNLVPAETALR